MKSNVVSRSVFVDFLPRACQAVATVAKSLVMVGMVTTVAFAAPAEAAPKYAGIVIDRASRRPVMMVSAAGGVDIEEVARETPEKIRRVVIDPRYGLLGH